MNTKLYILSFLTVCTWSLHSQTSNFQILEKTLTALNTMESVLYTSTYESIESGVTYNTSEDSIFFEFSKNLLNATPKYYIKNADSGLIYDSKHHTQILHEKKLILTEGAINPNNPLLLMIFPIRVLLPQLMRHEHVSIERKDDLLFNGENHYQFEFSLKNSVIDWEQLTINSFDKADSHYNTYTLIIHTSDFLPRKMQMSNGPSGTMSRTIEDFDFSYKMDPNVWTGALLPSEYTRMSFDAYVQQQRESMMVPSKENRTTTAPEKIGDWKLPKIEDNAIVDFSVFKGKVVVLEFWFKFCGPCVKAVPDLNALHQKYKNDDFLLYGVEFREDFPRKNLNAYASKIEMAYPLLYKGKELANTYSVQAAPSIMVIDKEGNIVYFNIGFDRDAIEKVVKEHL